MGAKREGSPRGSLLRWHRWVVGLAVVACLWSPLVLAATSPSPGLGSLFSVVFEDQPKDPTIPAGEGILMTLQEGQQFQCLMPSTTKSGGEAGASEAEEGESDQTSKAEVSPLTRAVRAGAALMRSLMGQCFIRLSGWWIYEFCFNKYIRQYHQDADKTVKMEFYLGRAGESQAITFGRDSAGPYYALRYSNGTLCDLTKAPRESEVRFYCSATSDFPLHYFSVEEPRSCEYVVSFYGMAVCSLEEFAAPATPVSQITCHRLFPEPFDELESADRLTLSTDDLPALEGGPDSGTAYSGG